MKKILGALFGLVLLFAITSQVEARCRVRKRRTRNFAGIGVVCCGSDPVNLSETVTSGNGNATVSVTIVSSGGGNGYVRARMVAIAGETVVTIGSN